MQSLTKEQALDLVSKHHWKHTFEIVPGIVTSGDWGVIDSAKLMDTVYRLPKDLTGKRALDIGALDGVHSFELERRGAQVTAIDIQDPNISGFNIAKNIIGSNVEYVQGNVYELSTLFKEKFDIVLFFGVWYHLKNPVKAFDEIARVMTGAGILCGEGEALSDYVEIEGELPSTEEITFARQMGASKLPISVYYSGKYKGDRWSWYVPNLACVHAWLETCGMELVSHSWWHAHPHQRLHIVAKMNQGISTTVDNPVW